MTVDRGEAEARALAALRANVGPRGLRASAPVAAAKALNYDGVFARDVAIAAPGLWVSGDATLAAAATQSLASLAACQAASGQIPKFVKGREGDFWYVTCPDATAWWLVAMRLASHLGVDGIASQHANAIAAAERWLAAQCHPRFGLVHQTEGGDWADMYPRAGYVLYSNAVWAWARWLAGDTDGWRETVRHARWLFRPHDGADPPDRRLAVLRERAREQTAPSPLWLGHVDLGSFGVDGDLFGNVLAALCGLTDRAGAEAIADAILSHGWHRPYPLRATVDPIAEDDPRWRGYMARHGLNRPHGYHNGGIWPFVGGFWALLLARLGRESAAVDALDGIIAASAADDWRFSEWHDGQTGAGHGMPGQSWNAAMLILALRAVEGRLTLPWPPWEG